jgi:hypothetical protein
MQHVETLRYKLFCSIYNVTKLTTHKTGFQGSIVGTMREMPTCWDQLGRTVKKRVIDEKISKEIETSLEISSTE